MADEKGKFPIRPAWCQDPSCTPDANTPGVQIGGPGDSAFCCGQVPDDIITERHGVTHRNDGHFCFRSPVRGVVMLEINQRDLENVARLALRGIVAREPEYDFNWRWFTGKAQA